MTTMVDGAALLDRVKDYTGRYVAYPSEAAHNAHVLWIAHAHRMDLWDSTPRIAFLSPEPGSGKTRALEVTELLVPRPILAVDCTPAYLFRKVADEGELPAILYDEIDTVFGPKAPDNEAVRGMLNAGHRKGAVAGRCVVHGKTIETIEMPAYCAVALAGLNDLPDTLMSRSVVVRMRRRAPDEVVEPFRRREAESEAAELYGELADWMDEVTVPNWPEMPEGIADRNADIWEALLVVADAAGGHWPATARVTAVTLVTDSMRDGGTLGVRLLSDLKTVFGDRLQMLTVEILDALNGMTESPWGDLHGKPLDARNLSRRLLKYRVKRATIRIGEVVGKGYKLEDLCDPWSRYVTAVEDGGLLDTNPKPESLLRKGAEAQASPLSPMGSVTSVTSVTPLQNGHLPRWEDDRPDWALPPEAFEQEDLLA
jgi:hypothetical protein